MPIGKAMLSVENIAKAKEMRIVLPDSKAEKAKCIFKPGLHPLCSLLLSSVADQSAAGTVHGPS